MRREQNLALVGAVVSGAVVAFGLLLLLIGRVNPDAGARVRGALLDIVTPVWSIVRAPFDGVGRAVDWGGDYFGAVSRNRRLETELAAARAELQRAAADRMALVQLKRVAAVRVPQRHLIATARIVSATSGSVVRTAMVSAGSSAGVEAGQPVISADGLIGRTVEAGRVAARVLLLTDPASRIPVMVVRTGQSALAVGANSPALELQDRVGADVPLKVGDRLVTSGDGGVFPPGVPVGTIIRADGDPPLLRPAANPVGAGFVNIEAAWLPLPAADVVATTLAPVPIEARRSGAKAPATTAAPIPRTP